VTRGLIDELLRRRGSLALNMRPTGKDIIWLRDIRIREVGGEEGLESFLYPKAKGDLKRGSNLVRKGGYITRATGKRWMTEKTALRREG